MISMLIGTRDREDSLIRCVQSALSQDVADLEVVVLDDASTRVDVQGILRRQFPDEPRLTTIRSNVRLGVAGGRNLLMHEARGTTFVVVDDDAVLESNHSVAAVKAILDGDQGIGIVAARIVDHREGKEELLVPFSRRVRQAMPGIDERTQEVSYYLGGCHAIRRALFDQVGGYQEDLMFGEEEVDIAYRAIGQGWRILYSPNFTAHHYPESSSFLKTLRSAHEYGEVYYHVRNRIWIAHKYIPFPYILTYLPFWIAAYAVEAIRTRCPKDFFCGLAAGFLGLSALPRTPLDGAAIRYHESHYGRLWY